jgi:prefoldin subunit 5
MNTAASKIEQVSEGKPESCNAARNTLNRHLRSIKNEMSDTETEIGISLEMLIETATHARNALSASNGSGRADIQSKLEQLRKLSDKGNMLAQQLELLKSQIKQLENVKVEIRTA